MAATAGGAPIRSFTEDEFPGLCDRLTAVDPDLKAIVEGLGYPPFWSRDNTYESLVWFILEQQVSLASAKAALEKLRARVGTITPENVLRLDHDELRAAYFSRQKAGYAQALAQEILGGRLELAALEKLPDADVRKRLVQLKGIGNWTVDVYLILTLHRSDVFPAGDLAAVNALKRVKSLPPNTTADEQVRVTNEWVPLRTIATMLLWHDYLSRRRSAIGAQDHLGRFRTAR